MKRLFFALTLILFALMTKGQTRVIQEVSASATVSGTADIVLITGGTGITLTFPTATLGRTFSIVNQSQDDVTFNVTVQYDYDDSTDFITHEAGASLPGTNSNSITVFYDGTVWTKLN